MRDGAQIGLLQYARVKLTPRAATGRDMLTTGDFGGGHGHDRTGDMAVASTGNVAARRIHRDGFLAGNHAGNDLKLDIRERAFLRFSKAAHIVMGKLDVPFQLFRHQSRSSFDLFLSQDHVAVVLVELGCVFQRLGVAAGFDIAEDRAYGLAHV